MLAIHYRKLIALLFLFAGAALAQKPKAPFSNPNDPDDPSLKLEYKGEIKIPANGTVTILFFPTPFVRPPSCYFKGGTMPGKAPAVTNYSVILKAKPGKHLSYLCEGIRETEKHE